MKYPSIVRDIVDFTNDTEVCNIGYNEGIINERPYRIEVWDSFDVRSATLFISTIDLKEEDIKKLLVNNKIIDIIEDRKYITEITDSEDNNFYSVNIPLLGGNTEINRLLVNIKPFD